MDAGQAPDARAEPDARSGCQRDQDCTGGDVCAPGGVCVAPSCNDGAQNGAETGVDCGGGTCPACADGVGCTVPGDCESGVCTGQVCQIPRCGDGVVNGDDECDDGNPSNADECTVDCVATTCDDRTQNGDEIDVDCGGRCGPGSCDLGQVCGGNTDCASDICVEGRCIGSSGESCLAILQAGLAIGDGVYSIDPDGAGGADPLQVFCNMTDFNGGWTACTEFVNTAVEDVNNNDWFDACVDFTMAPWSGTDIMVELRDEGGAIVYSGAGTRARDWTQNQLTSTGNASVQYDLNQHTPVPLSNGDKLIIPSKSGNSGGCHGALGNGYGVLVYPGSATSPQQTELLVLPYRFQVNVTGPRDLGQGNVQWFETTEISFDGTNDWNTCGFPPAFFGTFRFYVR
ncbi:fibrinogen-like YCDxxxxGGGW domain-containing protein [Haliangium sp.]|uniref:fibrinogen-like YCDxxxxGGGW domain-containing protein n=1 Tax=Haliangium sp. TaxID=2663208 RepID=UPI003D0B7810